MYIYIIFYIYNIIVVMHMYICNTLYVLYLMALFHIQLPNRMSSCQVRIQDFAQGDGGKLKSIHTS